MKKRLFLILFILSMLLYVSAAADTVNIPDKTLHINDEAFMNDTSVTRVILPEGVLTIGERAFANSGLVSIYLPGSLNAIGEHTFDGCPASLSAYGPTGTYAEDYCNAHSIPYNVYRVGISLPTNVFTRWRQDGERLKNLLEQVGYEVDLQFASNDVQTQLEQVTGMINSGCRVLVIAAVDGSSLGDALDLAKQKGIAVIAYDRLLLNSDAVSYYVTFDNLRVGALQGNYIKNALNLDKAAGPFNLEITAGDPGDRNALRFYNGAMAVLRPYIASGKLIVKSGQVEFTDVATPTWQDVVAQSRAQALLASYYDDGSNIDAWLCSNDSTALGVTNALEADYDGEWPIITGQDCDLDNVKNIIAGRQAMSVFKDTQILTAQTAIMVRQILSGSIVALTDTETYDNGAIIVPTYACDPLVVDITNFRELLIDTGYYTAEDLGLE